MDGHDPRTPEDLAAAEAYGLSWGNNFCASRFAPGVETLAQLQLDGSWEVEVKAWDHTRATAWRVERGAWHAPTLAGALALAVLDNWGE